MKKYAESKGFFDFKAERELSTKREDIVARELQKQEIYTEKRTDNCFE